MKVILSQVTTGGKHLCLVPCVKRPTQGSPGFLPPFWCVRRTQNALDANCHVVELPMDAVYTLGTGESEIKLNAITMVHNVLREVPVMTNHRKLDKGDELVMFVEPQAKKAKAKELDWRSGAKGSVGKKK